MKDQQKTINGFECHLYFEDETSFCDVIKGNYSGSLTLLENEGGLMNDYDQLLPVSEKTIDKILGWAQTNGW